MKRAAANETISAYPKFDHSQCISVFDAQSKKADTQVDINMSERPIIPAECTKSQNEDFLDKHIMKHVQDHYPHRENSNTKIYANDLALTDGNNS